MIHEVYLYMRYNVIRLVKIVEFKGVFPWNYVYVSNYTLISIQFLIKKQLLKYKTPLIQQCFIYCLFIIHIEQYIFIITRKIHNSKGASVQNFLSG